MTGVNQTYVNHFAIYTVSNHYVVPLDLNTMLYVNYIAIKLKGKNWTDKLKVVLLLFSHSVVSDFFSTPLTVACQAPLSMGLLKQEYWDGLPFPSPEDLPNPRIESASPVLTGQFFITELIELNWIESRSVRLFVTPWTDYTVHGILQARILK